MYFTERKSVCVCVCVFVREVRASASEKGLTEKIEQNPNLAISSASEAPCF
jgi:hypothetical protein